MKYIFFTLFLAIFGCGENTDNLYIVTTKVQVKQDQVDKILQLFKDTNPGLVESEENWKGALFSADYENNIVIVQAFWDGKEGYKLFSRSEKFKNTMKLFEPYFEGPPDVTITKFLYKM